MAPILIKRSITKAILPFIGSCIFFIGSILLIIFASGEGKLAGVLGILPFGYGVLFLGVQMYRQRPALIIDENGITDYSTAVEAGFIAWSEIARISLWKSMGKSAITILPHNAEAFIEKFSFAKRIILKENLNLTGAPCLIPSDALPYRPEEIFKIIEQYKNQASLKTSADLNLQIVEHADPVKSWNWGAALLGPIWGLGNGVFLESLAVQWRGGLLKTRLTTPTH